MSKRPIRGHVASAITSILDEEKVLSSEEIWERLDGKNVCSRSVFYAALKDLQSSDSITSRTEGRKTLHALPKNAEILDDEPSEKEGELVKLAKLETRRVLQRLIHSCDEEMEPISEEAQRLFIMIESLEKRRCIRFARPWKDYAAFEGNDSYLRILGWIDFYSGVLDELDKMSR